MATPPTPEPAIPALPLPGESPEAAPAAAVLPQDRQRALQRMIWIGLGAATLLFISPPTVMLIAFGLLPSFVALIIDRSEGKYAMFCVLGLNFSGLFPFLSDVWFETHSIDAAINILTDVFSLGIIYGAAAFGWMLYISLPPVVTSFLSVMSQRRVGMLKETQAKIVEEWGEGVVLAVDAVPTDEISESEDPPV